MADMAPATPNNEPRRVQMLRAAAELICERGFGETRIADVAKRAEASSALVIYYFGTKDSLLTEALRWSERSFYTATEEMLRETTTLRRRLETLVEWTLVSDVQDAMTNDWGLWFDLWAQAFRHPEVKQDRVELDARWRTMIVDVVKAGQADGDIGKVDVRAFAVTFAALLDGLSIQVALGDPEVDSERAYKIAMRFAERELGLPPARRRRTTKKP